MIRFVNLGKQLLGDEEEGSDQFTFYNTTRREFIEFNSEMVWDNIDEFIKDYTHDEDIGTSAEFMLLKRYVDIIPKDWNQKKK